MPARALATHMQQLQLQQISNRKPEFLDAKSSAVELGTVTDAVVCWELYHRCITDKLRPVCGNSEWLSYVCAIALHDEWLERMWCLSTVPDASQLTGQRLLAMLQMSLQ